ncbi:hypothetical protein Tco_0179020 [Tanacetum coccineum]
MEEVLQVQGTTSNVTGSLDAVKSNEDTIVALFGVPLSSIEDVDTLTRKIEACDYDEIKKGMTSVEWKAAMGAIEADRLILVMSRLQLVQRPIHVRLLGLFTLLMQEKLAGSRPIVDATAGISMAGFQQSGSKFGHVNEATIIQSISIQPNPYVGVAGVSISGPSKPKVNFLSLFSENLCNGVEFSIPRKVVEMVSTRFDNTLYGYFIGKRVAFPVV